jgi:hypothetical protein
MNFFDAMANISNKISPDTEETVRQRLQRAFKHYTDTIDQEGSREKYQQEVRNIADTFPKGFAIFQDKNTNARIEQLNKIAESNPVLPQDAYIQESMPMKMQVPYGFSEEKFLENLGGGSGMRAFADDKEYWKAPDKSVTVDYHEMQHTLPTNQNYLDKVGYDKEEQFTRSLDILRNVLTADEDREEVDFLSFGDPVRPVLQALDVAYPEWKSNLKKEEKKELYNLVYEVRDGEVKGNRSAFKNPKVKELLRKAVGEVIPANEYEDLMKTGFESTIK